MPDWKSTDGIRTGMGFSFKKGNQARRGETRRAWESVPEDTKSVDPVGKGGSKKHNDQQGNQDAYRQAAPLAQPAGVRFVERLPPAMRVSRKKFYLCVEKKNLQW